ncbi:hypothetical protein BH10PLA2_BH10PLA2_08390 [soil metagenome]
MFPAETESSTSPLAIENALLRGELRLTLESLKRYAHTPHVKAETSCGSTPLLQVEVSHATQQKALEAIKCATARLQDNGISK